jgi:HEAT repeat protein
VEIFAIAALVLGATSVGFLLVLSVRRFVVGRSERQRAALEAQLRPLAIALVEEGEAPRSLPPRAATAFAIVLGRYSRNLRGDAVARIASFFEESGLLAASIARLRHGRALVRAEAAFALGDMGSKQAIVPLLAALDDPDRDVRSAAVRSLGRLGAVDAVEPLLDALAAKSVPRGIVGSSLLQVGPAAVPRLLELVGHPDPDERAGVVQLVGLLGDPADARPLLERLVDTAAEVRAQGALALGRLGAEEAAQSLRELLHDRVPFVRAAAAEALGLIRDGDAVEALCVQARRDVYEPAAAAAEALSRIAPDRVALEVEDPFRAGPFLVEAADLVAL